MTGAERVYGHILWPGWRHAALGLAFTLCALIQPGDPVYAQSGGVRDISGLQYELNRLRQDVSDLQRQMATQRTTGSSVTSAPPTRNLGPIGSETAAAQLQLRIDRIELDLRRLTGQSEELGFRLTQIGTRLDKLVADVDFRLSALEKKGPTAPMTSNGAQAQTEISDNAGAAAEGNAAKPAATAMPDGTPEEQYAHAFGLLRKGDYTAAAAGLEAFLTANAEHELAGNAVYWLGETYYVRNDYDRAARYFLQGFEKYPKSRKGPDNLLKLGMTLAALDHKADACQAFVEIGKLYPDAGEKILSTASREMTKAGCPQ